MKILWIVQKNLVHDLDISTWIEMSKSLAKRNHQVILVALSTSKVKYRNSEPNLTIKEIRVVNRFPMVSITFHLQIFILSLFWLFTIQPEVIFTHPITLPFLLLTKLCSKLFKFNTKFILDIRTVPVRNKTASDKIKNKINHLSVLIAKKFFTGITVITSPLKRMISERFHIEPEQIGIWTSGVNIEIFNPKNNNDKMKRKNNEQYIIMYHGVVAQNRGLLETIKAMDYVNKAYPNIKLFILGKGLAYDYVVALVDQLNLRPFVLFHDKVNYNKIPDYISKADIGIIPLPEEPCWQVSSPLKLFEYLAMAKPVIVSPIEAHTSVLKDCRAAIFLKSTSPEDISEGIIKAYSNREHLYHSGLESRKYVSERFTWDHQAAKLEKFITNL